MAEERADALVEFWADDVFELAGLGVCFVIVDAKRVLEEAFRKTVAAYDVARAALAAVRQLNQMFFEDLHQAQVFHACEGAHRIHAAWGANVLDVRGPAFFAANPNLLEQVIEVNAIVHRDALVDGQVAVH
jgi:hypothetical protein